MKMTLTAITAGALVILALIVFIMVFMPYAQQDTTPSDIWRDRVQVEREGRN